MIPGRQNTVLYRGGKKPNTAYRLPREYREIYILYRTVPVNPSKDELVMRETIVSKRILVYVKLVLALLREVRFDQGLT